ncbi:MAG TPA: hypothetical protein VH142_23300 [Polyangiaceae bacterium]|nr:hypothetical protein [Polyangiaceae bacterium]
MALPDRLPRWALASSLGVHVAAGIALGLVFALPPRPHDRREPPSSDVWAGDTMEISDLAEPARDRGPALPAERPETPTTANATVGDTPEATRPGVAAASTVSKRTAPPLRSADGVAVPKRPAPRQVPPQKTTTEDPADALARKIFDYAPPSGASEGESATTRANLAATRSAPSSSAAAPASGAEPVGGASTPSASRVFARAFARAIPIANSGDDAWDTLPTGDVGSARVTIVVDENGSIASSTIDDKPDPPPETLSRLVHRTLALIAGGRFAPIGTADGDETLELNVTLSDRPIDNGPLSLGFEAPTPGKAGKAYFQRPSGRFVLVTIAVVQ